MSPPSPSNSAAPTKTNIKIKLKCINKLFCDKSDVTKRADETRTHYVRN